MSRFEDGSYGSQSGIALIAKVLAGRCRMKYTRAAIGKGTIPDDKLAGYVKASDIQTATPEEIRALLADEAQ